MSDSSPIGVLMRKEAVFRLNIALYALTKRERTVIFYRFYCEKTLQDAGELLGIGSERVRQIQAKAIRKLRHPHMVFLYGECKNDLYSD